MFEESNSSSPSMSPYESDEQPKLNMKTKKIIQKQLPKGKKKETLGLSGQRRLSREEKKQIQKEKNRMAAQISRDNRKKYIQELQSKIQQLQTQIQQQLCSRCQNTLLQRQPDNLLASDDHLQQPESMFLRGSPSSDSFGSIGSFFFIVMICLTVFSLSSNLLENAQTYPIQNRILHPLVPYEDNLGLDLIDEIQNGIPIVQPLHLSKNSHQNEQCFYEFLRRSEPEMNIYGQYHDRSIILCRNPQVFPQIQKPSDYPTLLGSELTVFMNGLSVREEQDFYNLEGIYKMELEIKTLEKVLGTSCII